MSDQDEDFSISNEDVDDSVVAEEHAGDALKKVKEKLKAAEEKAKEYLDGWQRERAEIANARKRDEDARGEFVKFANAGLIEQLMPVLDSLQLAVSHGEKGVEAIQNLLLKTLKQNGLDELNPVGEMFDPRQHEAVGMIQTDKENEDHKILEVVQKGYILAGKIIRPAKVRIGEFKS
jgi:molecular chaperone GrpE